MKNRLKKISNRNIIALLIVSILTFILALVFIFNIDVDFIITKTIFGKMTSSVDGNNPGAGEYYLAALFVSSLSFLGELGALMMIVFLFIIIPVCVNMLLFFVNIIARLFQIGVAKNWKNTTTKVMLYFSAIMQGILVFCLLCLSFSGFGAAYFALYAMLLVNALCLAMQITGLRSINKSV